jgi:opacity protein-like surface antigen
MSISKMLVAAFSLILFACAAVAQDPVQFLKASFERHKDKGWMTEITTWKSLPQNSAFHLDKCQYHLR